MLDLELAWNKPAKNWKELTDHVLRVRIRPNSDAQRGLPLRMAIALDTSSSMQGEKLTAAKQACLAVVAQLRDTDRLELASFSSGMQPLLKSLAGGKGAIEAANTAITKLQASGVTRTDMALDWIQKALPEEKNVVHVGILITDGHATNSQGAILNDVSPLLDQAGQLSNAGISLYTVGLGNADNFKTEFLVDLSVRGRGKFMYAETPSELEPQLKERLTASQAISINDAYLQITGQFGVKIKGFCQFRPDYLPLEEAANGKIIIGSIRTDVPTDLLLKVEIPPADTGTPPFTRDVLQVELASSNFPHSMTATTSISFTKSFSEYEQVNTDVETDLINWNIKANMDALIHLLESADSKQTMELLDKLENDAAIINRGDFLEQIHQRRIELEKDGKLDPRRTTRMLIDANKSS